MFQTLPARVHPLHALLLAFPVALFPFALASDVAYLSTAEMQWSNLAAWAITGALIAGAVALVWALFAAVRQRASGPSRFGWPGLLGVAWLSGLVNAFHHSRDAWSSVGMPGLLLSILSTLAALSAGWIAFSTPGERRKGR